MKTLVVPILFALPLFAASAHAQVLITEIQPNPNGSDFAEWVEFQNIGSAAVDVGGWSFYEFSGGLPSGSWVFPTGTVLQPSQVVLVAKQYTIFNQRAQIEFNGVQADFELAIGGDDAMIPNLTGGPDFTLQDGDDAVILVDNLDAYVDGVEYGSDRNEVPGAPVLFWPQPQFSEGVSARRVAVGGMSSATDFTVSLMPDPGMGYIPGMGTPPMVFGPMRSPPAFAYTKTASMSVIVNDIDGVMNVDFHVALASSVDMNADGAYVTIPATPNGTVHTIGGRVDMLATGVQFNEPTGFHERYVRWFAEASDNLGATARLPMDAVTTSDNSMFYWENVLPASAVFSIAEVREQGADEVPLWEGHSVRVEGVVTTDQTAFSDVESNFFISSPTTIDAIRVFDDVINPVDVKPGDLIELEGKIGVLRGVRQIGQDERTSGAAELRNNEIVIRVLGTEAVPIQVVDVATLLANAERYESQLVEIQNVEMSGGPNNDPIPSTFPAAMTVYVDDGTEMPVRIYANTTVVGVATPTGAFAIRGIFGQFTPGGKGGYQLQPRFAEDIDPDPTAMDAGVVDSGTSDSGDPNRDAGPRDAGPGAGRDAGVVDTGVGGGGGDKDPDSGCGCSTAESEAPSGIFALFLLLALLLVGRRRGRTA